MVQGRPTYHSSKNESGPLNDEVQRTAFQSQLAFSLLFGRALPRALFRRFWCVDSLRLRSFAECAIGGWHRRSTCRSGSRGRGHATSAASGRSRSTAGCPRSAAGRGRSGTNRSGGSTARRRDRSTAAVAMLDLADLHLAGRAAAVAGAAATAGNNNRCCATTAAAAAGKQTGIGRSRRHEQRCRCHHQSTNHNHLLELTPRSIWKQAPQRVRHQEATASFLPPLVFWREIELLCC